MKKISLIILIITVSINLFSQGFEVPKNYILDKVEDYAPYEKDIVNCVTWLTNTPIDKEVDKRKEANAFLLKWLMGSPNVHIDIKQETVPFMASSPDLLLIYMGGWAKYSIETKKFDDKVNGSYSGIETVIEFYLTNKKILKKDKHVEKFIKMKKKGTLKGYFAENV